MALPTLRLPMHRNNRRDDSLSLVHNNRHAEFMANGNASFSTHNNNERRQQRGQQHSVGFNDFRTSQSISRNNSSSRGNSVVNYSRSNENFANDSASSSVTLPRGAGFRYAEMNGGGAERGRSDIVTINVRPRDNGKGAGSMQSDIFSRNRVSKSGFFESQYPDAQNSCRTTYPDRYDGGNADFAPRFKSLLDNGQKLTIRKPNLLNNRTQVVTNVRKLEGCNTLKDGRDIEAIAPIPAPIKVFDRHGRELSTAVGGGRAPVPAPLQQNLTASIRGRNGAAREDHRPLQQLEQRRLNYYQPPIPGFHQSRDGVEARQNRYSNYDRSQSLLLGSQQHQQAPFPHYKPVQRAPLHAASDDFVNGLASAHAAYEDDVCGSGNVSFFSAGSNSPSGPSHKADNSSYYSSSTVRKRRLLSPPVEIPLDLSRNNYRGGGMGSTFPSPNDKRKRSNVLPTDNKSGKASDSNVPLDLKLHSPKSAAANSSRKKSDDESVASSRVDSHYHYKKCKLLGRSCKNAGLASSAPFETAAPLSASSSSNAVKSDETSEVSLSQTASSSVPTAVVAESSGRFESAAVKSAAPSVVVAENVTSLPVSAVESIPPALKDEAVAAAEFLQHISCCPCVSQPSTVNGASKRVCCLNAATASKIGKFVKFKAFQETRDRCQALLTGTVNARYVTDDAAVPLPPTVEVRAQLSTDIGHEASTPTSPATDNGEVIIKSTVSATDMFVEEAVVAVERRNDEADRFEAAHAAFVRKAFVEHFARLDMLAKLISHAEQWRHLVLRPSKADKASAIVVNEVREDGEAVAAEAVHGVEDPKSLKLAAELVELGEKSCAVDDEASSISIRAKQTFLLGSSVVSSCPQLRIAVDAGKFRAVIRYLKQFYSAMLNNLEATGLYQRALYGYQQRKRDKLSAAAAAESSEAAVAAEEFLLPKRLLLARSIGTFRRMLTNHRRLTVEKRVDYFLRCARDCTKLPLYQNVDDALALCATPIDAVISGEVHEKPSARNTSSSRSATVVAVSMRGEVRRRIKKKLEISVMMDKVFEQIQRKKRQNLLSARSDLCGNQTFFKGLDIVTQTFDKVNQRALWNEELDLLLGYEEIEEKMLVECQAPLNSYERRSKVSALADEKFKNNDTVEFILNMNNVPPPVNPYKPLRAPKVCTSMKSFFERNAAFRVQQPRKEFNQYITKSTSRWTQAQVELFIMSYRTDPKYWLEAGRKMSLSNPNDSVALYRMLKVSTYEYRLLHKLGGSLLTDADFSSEDRDDNDLNVKNNAGLLRHARPPYTSSLSLAAAGGRKTPVPFSFFHSKNINNNNNRQNILISGSSNSLKRPMTSEEQVAAAETTMLLTYPNKFLKTDVSKPLWKDGRAAAIGGAVEGGFFTGNASSSTAAAITSATPFFATSGLRRLNMFGSVHHAEKKPLGTACDAGSSSTTAVKRENSVLTRWSFDLSSVLARFGVNWYQLTIANSREVNEQYDAKLKALDKSERSDKATLKREQKRALKSAKRDARTTNKNGSAKNRPQIVTAASTAASSPAVAAEIIDDSYNISIDKTAGVADIVVIEDGPPSLEEEQSTLPNTAAVLTLMETAVVNTVNVSASASAIAADTATALSNDFAAEAISALLDLAARPMETFEPLDSLPSLPMPMLPVAEFDAIETPPSPTTPVSSPPPSIYVSLLTADYEPGSLPFSKLPPPPPFLGVVESDVKTPPLLPFASKSAESPPKHKKRGRRRRSSAINKKVPNNGSAAAVVNIGNVLAATSTSIMAAGAGRGIAKSVTKTVRAAKRSALAAFDNGGSSRSAAAAGPEEAVTSEAEVAEASAHSLETLLANQALAGLAACRALTSPPSGTISSVDEESSTPVMTPDVDRISKAIEREQKVARRNFVSQPLPVKPMLKLSSSSSSLGTAALIDPRKSFFADTNVLPATPGDGMLRKGMKKSRRSSLTPPTAVNTNRTADGLPLVETPAAPASSVPRPPHRRQPLPTKNDRFLDTLSDSTPQVPSRAPWIPPHVVLPVKSNSVGPNDSTTAAAETVSGGAASSEEKLNSQHVLVKGGGRKKVAGSNANQAAPSAAKNQLQQQQKAMVIASNSDTNVIVQVADQSTTVISAASPQSQQPAGVVTSAATQSAGSESSNFFRTGRQAVGSANNGRNITQSAVVSGNVENKPLMIRRGIVADENMRGRKPSDAASSLSQLSSPCKTLQQQQAASSTARFPASLLQPPQQQQTSTFNGSRFVSQTGQQQVTIGGGKSLVKSNVSVFQPKSAALVTNNAQFFSRNNTANKRVNSAMDSAGADKRNVMAGSAVFSTHNQFLSTTHHRHQENLSQQHRKRSAADAFEGMEIGSNVVFRSSMLMGDRKKRNDIYNTNNNAAVMPSSSSQASIASSPAAFARNSNKLLLSQGAMFPSSNSAMAPKSADLLIDDVLSAYKRSDKRANLGRRGAAENGEVADEGEFYENVSDTSS